MNIAELLRERAESTPAANALIDFYGRRIRRMTFCELELAAGQVATLLLQSGLRQGDTVLVLYPMSAELYVVLAAIFRLGLVAMFLDPSAGRSHIELSCDLRRPKALVAGARAHVLRAISPALRQIPLKFSVGLSLPGAISLRRARKLSCLEPIQPCAPEVPALVTFTSGSGGHPKAALRSHGFLLAQHRALEQSLALSAGQIDLSMQPIFVLANLASGVTSVITDVNLRSSGPRGIARIVSQYLANQVTRSGGSPPFFERLVKYCEDHGTRLPGLERIYTGGGPVYPQLLEGLQRIAPRATITAVYGSTEAEPIACIAYSEVAEEDMVAMLAGRGLLAGPPVQMVRLRIMRNQWGSTVGPYTPQTFNEACQPWGTPGEIVVSGEHVLSGYLRKSDDLETKFSVGEERWHRTGDAGYLDPHGRLWLLGRCSGCIDDVHGILYPFSVEHITRKNQQVYQVAVVLVRGQRVLAVELRRGRLGASHRKELLELLNFAKVEQIRVLRRLPVDRRHQAKIDYAALRGILEKRC